MRLTLLLTLLSGLCFSQGPTYQEAFPGLTFTAPVELLAPPDGTKRLFVVQQNGIIKVFPNKAGISSSDVKDFLNISSRIVSGGERGLLGMAFHPDYKTNGFFYVIYTRPTPLTSVVSRFRVRASNPNEADPDSELILFTQTQPFDNHNGGKMAFGKDGFLYISIGDGGSAGDPQNHAQNRTNLLGKIMRIDVNGTAGSLNYRIPDGNPYKANTQGFREEIFAYGLRNVWKFSIDPKDGTIWAADVGQNSREEINIITAGGNYGWRLMEGTLCYNPATNCNPGGLIMPIFEYPHTDNNRSITGGHVYRGIQIPEWQGHYIYGDYISGRIWKLVYENNTAQNSLLNSAGGLVSAFGEDHNREIYVVRYSTANAGRIFRYFPQPPAAPSSIILNILPNKNVLEWDDLSNNELGFIIERAPEGTSNFTVIDTAGFNSITYTDNVGIDAPKYDYRIRAYNDGGFSAYAVTDEVIVGMEPQQADGVVIYPNPSDGHITIEIPEAMLPARVMFFNLQGKLLGEYPLPARHSTLQVQVAAGLYLLKINAARTSVTKTIRIR